VVYNIIGLTAGTYYDIKVRILASLSATSPFRPTVTIQTNYNPYVSSSFSSIVDQYNSFSLNVNPNLYYTTPNQFQINNPRIAFQSATVGYIGKF
jgi:hypothetical protein